MSKQQTLVSGDLSDALEASQQKVVDLQRQNARLEERIKELEKENANYYRRAYSARMVLHELLDMALFEKGTSTKY